MTIHISAMKKDDVNKFSQTEIFAFMKGLLVIVLIHKNISEIRDNKIC